MWRTRTVIGLSRNVSQNKKVHVLNATKDQTYAAMTDIDPEGLENRKPILKKKKTKSTFSSVGPNWVLSMDGHEKLMGY